MSTRCWLSFEDGDHGHEVMYDCELELGHHGWHMAHVQTASDWGVITWDVLPGVTMSRGWEGDGIQAAKPHGAR